MYIKTSETYSHLCKSLNNCLYPGPTKLPEITGILLRNREPVILMPSDVEKAFVMIGLRPDNRDVTRYIWLKDINKPLSKSNMKIRRFQRIGFGFICSTAILSLTLDHHLTKFDSPLAQQCLENTFVDNTFIHADNENDAKEKFLESKELFASAGMNLREHISNNENVNSFISERQPLPKGFIKILGIPWDIKNDTLEIHSIKCPNPMEITWTKRNVLVNIAQAFDPMGFLVVLFVKPKTFFQSLWTKPEYEWDTPLKPEDVSTWISILSEISNFHIQIPRFLFKNLDSNEMEHELHIFADASKDAYATAVYLRTITTKEIRSNLILAKSRLCPVKRLTIPRLELMGMLIAIRAAKYVSKEMKIQIKKFYFWSDSYCVLHWIGGKKQQKRFEQNRLNEIKSFPEAIFRYVPTDQNPADLATRGVTAENIHDLKIWWHGPNYLLNRNDENWPKLPVISDKPNGDDLIIDQDDNTIIVNAAQIIPKLPEVTDCIGMKNFNSLDSLLMAVFFFIRYIKKWSKNKFTFISEFNALNNLSSSGSMNFKDYNIIEKFLIILTQQMHFPTSNDIEKFHIYCDDEGILRCRSRIRLYSAHDIRNHPIYLPKYSELARLITIHYHVTNCHAGPAQTLANIRRKFWIPKARSMIRKNLYDCFMCRRHNAKPFSLPQMADLPDIRIKPSKVFQFTGVDMIGPYFVKLNEKTKIWIALFTCLTSRATHLEHVCNMSTPSFIDCMRRFLARRGRPEIMYSDNAPTFQLAAKIMAPTVQWHFNIAFAPWQGGYYERLVKIIKNSFNRTIGKKCLNYEHFQTLLTEVENSLNCRPITSVHTGDLDQINILRPIDFLIPEYVDATVNLEATEDSDGDYLPADATSKEHLLKRWQATLQTFDRLWSFWSSDYLQMLREKFQNQHKQSHIKANREPKIGEVVIVHDDALPRNHWRLAVITKIKRSSTDSLIRAATVRLATGNEINRPLNLLFPLEIRSTEAEIISSETLTNENIEENPAPEIPINLPNETNTTEPSSNPPRYNLRPRTNIQNASLFMIIAMLTIFITASDASQPSHECPPHITLQRVDIQQCALQAMAVMKLPDGKLCWKIISCTINGEKLDENHCNQSCQCPPDFEGCSYYDGKLTHESTIQLDSVKNALEEEIPKVCSFNPSTFCDTTPTIGRFSKVLLYDNTTHLVKDLHLLRKELIPEEYDCIGDGPIIGSPRYCELHSCNSNGTKFCFFKRAEIIFLVTDNGNLPIKAWGTGLYSYYKFKLKNSENPDCTSCYATCTNTGIILKLSPQIGNYQYCYNSNPNCHHQQHPSQNEIISLPNDVLLTNHNIKIIIWSNGFVIKKIIIDCPPKNICDIINCYICWDMIGNPKCLPNEAIILFSIIFYGFLSILFCIWKRIKSGAKTCKFFGNILYYLFFIFKKLLIIIKNTFVRLFSTILKLFNRRPNSNRPNSNNPNRFQYFSRSRRAKAALSLAILITLLNQTNATGCSEIVSLSSINENCLLTPEGLKCNFTQNTLLTVSPQGQDLCLILKNMNNQKVGMLTLKISSIASYCKPKTEYFTREHFLKVRSSKRCRSAGSCYNDNCENTLLTSKIEELNGEPNESPGHTYCAASCGCLGCGCFWCSSACLYYRLYAIPKTSTPYEIFSCPHWETRFSLDAVLQLQNETQTHKFQLIPGQTSTWNHIKLSFVSHSLPQSTLLSKKFITDFTRVSMIEASSPGQFIAGQMGNFQCKTLEEAKKFNNCTFSQASCQCRHMETKAICDCPNDNIADAFSNPEMFLPLETNGLTIEGWQRTVKTTYSSNSAIQLQLQISNLQVIALSTKAKCSSTFDNLRGCYNCLTGAEVDVSCKTDYGSAVAYVECENEIANMKCHEKEETAKLRFSFKHSKIHSTCNITCPGGVTTSKLTGDLDFVGHDTHGSYSRIITEEVHTASSMDIYNLLNWIYAMEHLPLFLLVILLIGAIGYCILKNSPMFQSAKLINNIVKKDI